MDIGSKIKEYRNKEGLTQVELAAKANISRSYLADVEKNRYNASVETLQKISTALGIPVAQLLSTEEKLELVTGSLDEIHETVTQYYASKSNVNELQFDAEANLLMNKIKKLPKKERNIVEVLVNQLLKEE
ncbi:helix-turn-helix transcriptional regulator [Clostridium tagluense]|uniref:helix-turn-helix domain-containing protein n=1 Tax=Clostridium tagluense TaxID=360422 RepID=UPI001C6E1A4B|nr:helix-turn-helix transcriptional regulator [Clostridium tagluense]MBW9158904.1 helix-turn-helix transcriptional regulator [Clostridium tagluense]MCB2310685.1 helix-turn-helix transcriptional regulator [Clostridium tagluense]MCB2315585.1 helix-turn-helix transcriptional regulator [Clostridium tagluense]MCB2320439.1 helix-turn-helix transcriptional regulator [Clostridium tagluense]MCB2325278.1 helix-turn-helix transcriptional regulator [Clostridium tagluense]